MKIQSVLKSCEMQMENQQSKQLRSEVLLSLLKAERENKKLINTDKNFTAVQMSEDMDKQELVHELNYAILLLTDYQKTQSLSIAAPSNAFTREFAAKLNSIKDSIEAILTKYQTD